jgi:hypothetical protein
VGVGSVGEANAVLDQGRPWLERMVLMAMTLSRPHPDRPYQQCGVKLGDYQFERSARWEKKGLLALAGMGVEPGLSDVFARYAAKHLFDEIDEIGVLKTLALLGLDQSDRHGTIVQRRVARPRRTGAGSL